MTWFLVILGIAGVLAIGAAITLYAIKVDRTLVARAEVRTRQRQAEADVQRVVQHTIQRMFDAARSSERGGPS